MSDPLWPHGLQPTRLFCPWDSPRRILKWLPCPSAGALPDPGTELTSSALAGGFFTSEPPLWNPCLSNTEDKNYLRTMRIKRNRDWKLSQFSCSVVSNSLRPHGLQHIRLPCPSPTARACWNSCPSSWWCHPTISSSVIPFSSCLESFSASGSFPMSPFFTLGSQSIGASASASVLPMNIQDWFPLGVTGLISLLSKGLSRVFSNTTVQKHQFFCAQLSL